MIDEIFKNSKPNFQKLQEFGFKKNKKSFELKKEILDGQFTVFVNISESGEIKTKTIDNAMEEEYILHLVSDATGGFVGKVRSAFENLLNNIKENCFTTSAFSEKQTMRVVSYIEKKYSSKLEFLWEKLPNCAIWRRGDTNKWFGILMSVPKCRITNGGDELIEIIDVRADPEEVSSIVDNKNIFPGYHMNKKHWITICMDDGVPDEKIFELVDNSFSLATK